MWGVRLVIVFAVLNLMFLFGEVFFNIFGVMLGWG